MGNSEGGAGAVGAVEKRRLTVGEQAWVLDHLGMAVSIAKLYTKGRPGMADELDSVACEALVDSVVSFDGARGMGRKNWAGARVRWALADYLKAHDRRAKRHAQLDDPGAIADQGEPACNLVETAEAVGVAAERAARILAAAPPREAEALRAVYADGLSLAEAAAATGRSKSAVRRWAIRGAARARAAGRAGR